jgi:plasmid maintenance system antidote protein VapI
VPDIRARHAAGMSIKGIARALGIPRTTIADIVHYHTWKQLEDAS